MHANLKSECQSTISLQMFFDPLSYLSLFRFYLGQYLTYIFVYQVHKPLRYPDIQYLAVKLHVSVPC